MNQVAIQPIPPQVVNELAAFGPFDLKDYVKAIEGAPAVHFRAGLKNGQSLPQGMICTDDGVITGIPAKGTQGVYEILISIAQGDATSDVPFALTIKPSFAGNQSDYNAQLKAQVWEALDQHLPIPDLIELLDRPVTKLDVYYLLERWGVITIWDAFNLDPPGEKTLLTLPGASEHYLVYDRGSSLVGCPKNLFSHERTLEDGIKTAKAMANEIYKRDWTIEMAGIDKLTRAVWVETRMLADKYGKAIEVINYTPAPEDLWLYNTEASLSLRGGV